MTLTNYIKKNTPRYYELTPHDAFDLFIQVKHYEGIDYAFTDTQIMESIENIISENIGRDYRSHGHKISCLFSPIGIKIITDRYDIKALEVARMRLRGDIDKLASIICKELWPLDVSPKLISNGLHGIFNKYAAQHKPTEADLARLRAQTAQINEENKEAERVKCGTKRTKLEHRIIYRLFTDGGLATIDGASCYISSNDLMKEAEDAAYRHELASAKQYVGMARKIGRYLGKELKICQ